MRFHRIGHMAALTLLMLAAGFAPAGQTTPPSPPSASDSPGLTFMAGIAGAIGSFFYLPFKAGAICPGMAIASGASLLVTGGDRATAERLLRTGCAGTYLVTPEMVRGLEEFQGAGGHREGPDRVRGTRTRSGWDPARNAEHRGT